MILVQYCVMIAAPLLCLDSCVATLKKSCSNFHDTSAILCHGSYATTLLECCVATLRVRNHAATSMIPVQYFIMVAVPLLCLDSCVATL